jgi:hypothetical protein
MVDKAKKPNHEGAQHEFKVQPKTSKLLKRVAPAPFYIAMRSRPA